jgi:hypothetical protein
MAEMWWAEAVIPRDRKPDWTAAYATLKSMTVDQFDWKWEEYLNHLDEKAICAADPVAAPLMSGRPADADTLLLPHVRQLVRNELDVVAEALNRGRPCVCAFETADVRVFMHFSGYGAEPDPLCDAWLDVDTLGLLRAAGFLRTTPIDGCE